MLPGQVRLQAKDLIAFPAVIAIAMAVNTEVILMLIICDIDICICKSVFS